MYILRHSGEGRNPDLEKRIVAVIFFYAMLCMGMSPAIASSGLITQCGVNNIKIGDSTDKIYKTLMPKYKLKTINHQSLKEIDVFKDKKRIMHISITDNKVFLIDVYALYSTEKNIQPGSTLDSVLSAYGEGKVNPTDIGYFVWFKDYPGIQFLIDNNGVPEKLRDIPDDVIKEEQEKQILNLKKAKISAIQVFCHD
jgi:hypothetical protein